jgi:hypothetical protein
VLTVGRAPIGSRRERFRSWRAQRPFIGAVLMALSSVLLFLPAFSTLKIGDLLVSVSTIAGVSTLALGSFMVLCAAAVLLSTAARIPAGLGAMLLALIALPAANFGGFVLGTVLGVLGSAYALTWRPPPARP